MMFHSIIYSGLFDISKKKILISPIEEITVNNLLYSLDNGIADHEYTSELKMKTLPDHIAYPTELS